MKNPLLRRNFLASCLAALAAATRAADAPATVAAPARRRHVVLVGASIGQEWNLGGLAARTANPDFTFEAVQAWQFDKSELLAETLARPARTFRLTPSYFKSLLGPAPLRADIVILKECSSYFPERGGTQDREQVAGWARDVVASGRTAVLATVVPVTVERNRRAPGKQEALRAYNDWVRDHARAQKLPLLDLEAALRADPVERFMRPAFDVGDGTHLNGTAYAVLDRVLIDALCAADGLPCGIPSQAALRQ